MNGNQNSTQNNKCIVALDIGTSKTVALACEISPNDDIEFIGYGHKRTVGMQRGMIANIEQVSRTVQRAVNEAQHMAEKEIENVFAAITGAHITGQNSSGSVEIRSREVANSDVERAIDAAKAVTTTNDEQVLQVLPQSYQVDNQDRITDPVGMFGRRLTTEVHVITGSVSAVRNTEKCIQNCDLEIDDLFVPQISSGTAVLTENEMELGVLLIDMGEGTTEYAVYHQGALKFSKVLPYAGLQITKDIALYFRVEMDLAEKIKHRHGFACESDELKKIKFEISEMDNRSRRQLNRLQLAQVIQSRVEEYLYAIKRELAADGYNKMIGTGVVITGGCAKLENITDLVERVFNLPAKVGIPQYSGPLCELVSHPGFALSVGTCQFVAKHARNYRQTDMLEQVNGNSGRTHWMFSNFRSNPHEQETSGPVMNRLKSWFQGGY